MTRTVVALALTGALALSHGSIVAVGADEQRSFPTAEDAVRGLIAAAKGGNLGDLIALFGTDGQDLVDSSDPATGRRNREVFIAAVAEGWRLVDQQNQKVLIVGNEGWPFPVPLARDANGWRFDTAAGKDEVLARRIGRNELAVITICQTYVAAQHRYALQGRDGKPAGLYAKSFRSDPGHHNGLYWPVVHGQPYSPLGDLVAGAEQQGISLAAAREEPSPFHGYYFKILTAQGAAAPGGKKDYVVNGELSAGFALVAWPAEYDESGIMTFLVNHEGIVYQKDLGTETKAAGRAITLYDPDASWAKVP